MESTNGILKFLLSETHKVAICSLLDIPNTCEVNLSQKQIC
ncbi:hypothetical protein NGA_0450900 [Nannochloropsis gaditana CCMP526]|nr:hypothetical protein NGA_0450900 [Nannochloropsis gaditana CCMP526]EKU22822.1 hypothetical protein NGA_0450900 [Nannochloropsis gaditana CCMP526]|eukprot:XP_005853539.1 hypothetical protein NGA_0450900 [Nannochloropsis gaditana CCMP526]